MNFIPFDSKGGADGSHMTSQNVAESFTRTTQNEDSIGCRVGHIDVKCTIWHRKQNVPKIIRLHNEIKHFYECMMATPDERLARQNLLDRIASVVTSLWSGAKVDVFGSFKTGLFLPTSDLDVVVFGRWNSKPLHTLSEALIRQGLTTKELTQVIEKATVPIIKFTDTVTGIKVDISFNMTNGAIAADMIEQYIEEYPSLPYLVMVLKQFFHERNLNDVYTGGIGSFSLILLVLSFLQLHSRADVQNVKSEKTAQLPSSVNYGVLLLEFFELYGINFNYGWAGISVRDGGRYVKKEDGEMTLYIEDPLCPENDVARGTFNMAQIRQAMAHAYYTLSNAVLESETIVSDDCDGVDSTADDDRNMICDASSILSRLVRMPHQKMRASSSKHSKKKLYKERMKDLLSAGDAAHSSSLKERTFSNDNHSRKRTADSKFSDSSYKRSHSKSHRRY